MPMTLAKTRLGIFIISGMLAVNVFASSTKGGFKDPLHIAATEQKNPLDRPFVGSSRHKNTVVLVGSSGLIMVSADTGETWKQAKVPVQSDLVAVDMVSGSKGWAVGHDGVILATSDGGVTWTKQLDGIMAAEQFKKYYENLLEHDHADDQVATALELTELNYRDGPGLPYLDVWFENESVGMVVGAFGNIARTEDGGATWLPWAHRVDNEMGYHLNSVAGIGGSVFISSERGSVFKLNNETNIFEIIETGYQGSFTGVVGDEYQVVAYGLRGTTYRSTDGGVSWQIVKGLPRSTINDAVQRAGQGFVLSNQDGKLILADQRFSDFEIIDSEETVGLTSVVELGSHEFLGTTLSGVKRISLSDQENKKPRLQE